MSTVMQFNCGSCKKALKIETRNCGKKVRCSCGRTMRAPDAECFAGGDNSTPAPGTGGCLDLQTGMAIVEEYKRGRTRHGTFERLGEMNPKHVANARSNYANEMRDDESPLAMLDGSFLQNGSSGVLVTTRAVYSSDLERPIPLARVTDVEYAEPSSFDYWMFFLFGLFYGPLQATLYVNRKRVFAARMTSYFRLWTPERWAELLEKLALADHEQSKSASRRAG